jgi:uncharacterized protein YkuJ
MTGEPEEKKETQFTRQGRTLRVPYVARDNTFEKRISAQRALNELCRYYTRV